MTECDSSAAVVFDHVQVRRGRNIILDDVCATVPRGGNTVLVGPNGAGKTTLLLCLIGELKYRGRILPGSASPQRAPRIGYVPQQLQMDGGLPLLVSEFLALGHQRRPLWLGLKGNAHKRTARLLELVEAEKLQNRRMGDLSGGELRRVLLAAALGRRPDLLVLDEAEAGVDFQGERLFWGLLDTARKEYGFTQVMVSHNLPLAAHFATHIICLNKSVQAEGSPRSTLTSANLWHLFGVPIHLYPDQCECGTTTHACPQCGALFGPDQLTEHEAAAIPPSCPARAQLQKLHAQPPADSAPSQEDA